MRESNLYHPRKYWRRFAWLKIVLATLLVIVINFQGVEANESEASLPSLQIHPLPPSLAQWQDKQTVGDYFEEIKPTSLGYLVWSNFPLKVYIERPTEADDGSASFRRFQEWTDAVVAGIEEWNIYLPLIEVETTEVADIIIKRSRPPLNATLNQETGKLDIPRARSAQTSYKFYLRQLEEQNSVISLRMTIQISPSQGKDYTLATIRHELGHALGIWGHSTLQTDALYFSQVADPPPISARDINTLKKIYQQPTRLGWAF